MVAHAANKDASAGHTTAQTLKKTNRLGTTPDPGRHQPQRSYAQGRTAAEQTQATAPVSKSQLGCIRSSHNLTDDQAGRQTLANAEADGCWRVHTAEDTTSTNAAARPNPCNSMWPGGCRPRTAAGSRSNGPRQAVAAKTGRLAYGNAASNTASAGADPARVLKRSSRGRVIAIDEPMLEMPGCSNSKCCRVLTMEYKQNACINPGPACSQ